MDKDSHRRSFTLSRPIFCFYDKGLRYVPIVIMLCHWYGTFHFHSNPHEFIFDAKGNKPCILFFYFMAYVFPVLFMLPASRFFRLCWIYRIPFVYMIGINVIRIYYQSYIITNDMYKADIILIALTLFLYICGLAQKLLHAIPHKIINKFKFKAYENRKPTC